MPKTPVTIVTGYLGSGKTTLLRRILDETGRRLAILMNEFGEIGIDGTILKGKNVNIIELSGGCVCCSLTGEFEAAVREIIGTVNPETIVVETTGVAEPDALVTNVRDVPQVRLDAVVTVVDAYGLVKFPSLGHTGRVQIEMADVLLLNKVDLVSPEELHVVESKLKSMNPKAMLFKTVRCNIDTKILFGIEAEKLIRAKHGDHVEEEGIEAFTYSFVGILDRGKFEGILGSLPSEIYRAKGFVNFLERSYLFNYVAGRWDLEEFSSNETSLVFIGANVGLVRDRVISQLRGCEIRV